MAWQSILLFNAFNVTHNNEKNSIMTLFIQAEHVKSDVDYVEKSLKETIVPEVS